MASQLDAKEAALKADLKRLVNSKVKRSTTQRVKNRHEDKLYFVSRSYFRETDFEIRTQDYKRLQPGKWLNSAVIEMAFDRIINNYVETRFGQPVELYIIQSCIYSQMRKTKGAFTPMKITQKRQILSYPFVAMSINPHDDHWILVIGIYLSDLQAYDPSSCRAAILILDSFNRKHASEVPYIQALFAQLALSATWEIDFRLFGTLPVHYVKVPQQLDGFNCGLYPPHLLSVFLSNPHRYARHCTGAEPIDGDVSNIWQSDDIKTLRESLKEAADDTTALFESNYRWKLKFVKAGIVQGLAAQKVLADSVLPSNDGEENIDPFLPDV